MKAIILAAWKWTRLRPFTNTIPKPILKIFWKTILEHNMDAIYDFVDEFIIVVNYKKNEIISKLWDNYKWVKITYHEQIDKKWTWAALMWIDTKDEVLVLYWDSILEREDLVKIIKSTNYGWLVQEVPDPEKYWIYKQDEKWFALEVVEKPLEFIWNLANIWWFRFSPDIFKYVNNLELSKRWEYELTDAINIFIKNNKFELISISKAFIDVWYPWHILEANKYFLENKLKLDIIDWHIEENVKIEWTVYLEKWAIIKSWTYIEWTAYIWKDSVVWPNAYLRWNVVIWEKSKVWNAVELKNVCLWDNSKIPHLSYLGDSVIWNNVNLWCSFITANLRHDNKNVKVMINGELVDSGLRKLGCMVWDNVKTGINTSIYPGRIIENDSFTMPWEIVK